MRTPSAAGAALLLALLLAGTAAPACAADAPAAAERLQVSEPYLEMRTGPGRGYPVFFVVEKLQWIAVELRRTDWYRVRAEGGQVGWVQRQQLESTLTAAGGTKTFRDLLLDDYLKRRVEFSGGWGRFKGEPMLRLGLQARLADTLGAEFTVGQVQGLFSGTDFWHVSLVSEPWSDRRLSPYFSVGLGKFRNIPNTSLVDAAATDAKLAHASLGLRWHLSERFTARLDWTLYTAFVADTRSTEYRSLTAGLGFYF
ncbi:MAG: SH3 domain-containing protein [Rubrivivax sp.]|nr:SH3 domain-containing protein [Rubrivivax sp.]